MRQVICDSHLFFFFICAKVITLMQGNLAILDNVWVSSLNQVEAKGDQRNIKVKEGK